MGDRTIIQCESDKLQKCIGCSGSTYKGHLIQLCGVSVGREWYICGVEGQVVREDLLEKVIFQEIYKQDLSQAKGGRGVGRISRAY